MKGLRPDQPVAKKKVFGTRTSFRAERIAAGPTRLAKNPQLVTFEPHFVRKGFPWTLLNRKFTSAFDTRTRTSFLAKRLPRKLLNRNFTTIQPHFVQNGCRRHFKIAIFLHPNFISCERVAISRCLVGTPRGLKREKRKRRRESVTEGKERARERESRQERRCEDGKMRRQKERRCVKMCTCEGVKM